MTANKELLDVEENLHQILRPYGLYLMMRGMKKGEQRMAFSLIGVVVLSFLVWALKTYLKSYLEEKGKLQAQKETKAVEVTIRDPTKTLEDLRKEVRDLADDVRSLKVFDKMKHQPNSHEVARFLMGWGLPEQQASNLSPKMISVFVDFVYGHPARHNEEGNDYP